MTEIEVEVYIKALSLAQTNNQVVGKKNDYYITLAQLEAILYDLRHL